MCQTSKVIKITFWRLPLTCIKLCCVSPNRFWVFVANKRTTTTFHEVAPLYRNSRKFSLVMWIIGTQYWCRIFFRCYIISKMRHIKKVLPKIYKKGNKFRHFVGKCETKGLKQPATHFFILSAIVSSHKTKSKFALLCTFLCMCVLQEDIAKMLDNKY